jgi:hypothetical protein
VIVIQCGKQVTVVAGVVELGRDGERVEPAHPVLYEEIFGVASAEVA